MTAHWLKIQSWYLRKGIRKILEYAVSHQASIELYYESNSVDGSIIVKLVCDQNYDNLELDVNSGSSGIIRFSRKPRNICKSEKDVDFLRLMFCKYDK